MTFEENIKRLEEIVAQLESGECSFEQATTLFKEGKDIAQNCAKVLDENKGKITELVTELDNIVEREMK